MRQQFDRVASAAQHFERIEKAHSLADVTAANRSLTPVLLDGPCMSKLGNS